MLANGDARAGKQHWVPRKSHQLPTREQAKDGQGERKGTPQNGSAARVKDVEVRFFDTEAAAQAYVAMYTAAHDSGR